jgi:hypothetical protein
MFRPSDVLIDSFIDHLKATYVDIYGAGPPDHCSTVLTVARMALSRVARSDALYFDVEHTINTTMVGIEMMYGRIARSGVFTSQDWVHVTCALLCAHVGMVRGVLDGDREDECVVDALGETIVFRVGQTDAALWQYAAQRSALFVQQKFQGHLVLDPDDLGTTIVRANMLSGATGGEPGSNWAVVRAALVVGILANPSFERKLAPLFIAAEQADLATFLGFSSVSAVRDKLAAFFWDTLSADIGEGIQLLDQTGHGRTLLSNMYAHLLASEHGMAQAG